MQRFISSIVLMCLIAPGAAFAGQGTVVERSPDTGIRMRRNYRSAQRCACGQLTASATRPFWRLSIAAASLWS